MMKRMNRKALVLPLVVSLCVGNVHAHGNNDGFIAGACAIGAGLLAAAGVAAIADWCCSETDDQLIARVDRECRDTYNQYAETMNYFGAQAGVGIHPPHRPIHTISEPVLYELATYVWNSNTSQSDYRSRVWAAKNRLQSCVQDVHKRIRYLEGKGYKYEEQQKLSTMRKLVKSAQQLLADIALFADCLECHKTNFTLYDSVGKIRNKYIQEITIFESGRYSVAVELKQCVFSRNNGRYPFKSFVEAIESDISTLQSNVYYLKYTYENARNYANGLIEYLIGIKNIIVADSRYQQELYEYQQECLERQRIEALEAQARFERERMRLERERNRILEERNRIERQKMYVYPVVTVPVVEKISVTFEL